MPVVIDGVAMDGGVAAVPAVPQLAVSLVRYIVYGCVSSIPVMLKSSPSTDASSNSSRPASSLWKGPASSELTRCRFESNASSSSPEPDSSSAPGSVNSTLKVGSSSLVMLASVGSFISTSGAARSA